MLSYAEWLFKAIRNFPILSSFLIHLFPPPTPPISNSFAHIYTCSMKLKFKAIFWVIESVKPHSTQKILCLGSLSKYELLQFSLFQLRPFERYIPKFSFYLPSILQIKKYLFYYLILSDLALHLPV